MVARWHVTWNRTLMRSRGKSATVDVMPAMKPACMCTDDFLPLLISTNAKQPDC